MTYDREWTLYRDWLDSELKSGRSPSLSERNRVASEILADPENWEKSERGI